MRRFWILAVALVLAGCGGSAAKESAPAQYGGTGAAQYAPGSDLAPQSESAGGSAAPAPATASVAPPADSPRADKSSQDREARERPGLGTEWGETRASRVHDVTFVRADEDRPFAVATLHYNDRTGVEALASYHADRAPRFREIEEGNGAITVSILDGRGDPLEALKLGDRTYVIGTAGDRYTIALTNHTGHRFEAVATVDGLDVLNGKPGTLESRGYVLNPFATVTIDGFRQSHEAVAAFRFGTVSNSYAAQTGSARNVGVIGVAFFNEAGDRFDPYSQTELHTRDTASPFPAEPGRFARPPR